MRLASLLARPRAMLGRLQTQSTLTFLRRVHRLTQRLPVELRKVEAGRTLMVAPHMDDEVIGAGGTLALLKELGAPVHVVFCAAGATAEQDRVRTAEARAAAQLMRFDGLEWLGFPEGKLSPNEDRLAAALASVLRRTRPDRIFCPFPTDHHRDHNAVAQALALATEAAKFEGEVWSYEVWSPLWPNVAVDISRTAALKRQAIGLHTSQVAGLHYPDGILGLNRYRGLRVYVDYAEAFYVASAAEFRQLAGAMNRLRG